MRILTSVTDQMDKKLLKLSSSIKIIANGAVGFGNIDLEAAKKRGITVTNTPDVLSDATAEIGILLIIRCLLEELQKEFKLQKKVTGNGHADYLLGKQMSGTSLEF